MNSKIEEKKFENTILREAEEFLKMCFWYKKMKYESNGEPFFLRTVEYLEACTGPPLVVIAFC